MLAIGQKTSKKGGTAIQSPFCKGWTVFFICKIRKIIWWLVIIAIKQQLKMPNVGVSDCLQLVVIRKTITNLIITRKQDTVYKKKLCNQETITNVKYKQN